MTFEEAIEIIEEVDGEVGAIGYIINKLQETYAPKIKMTFEQKDELMQFLGESDFGFAQVQVQVFIMNLPKTN